MSKGSDSERRALAPGEHARRSFGFRPKESTRSGAVIAGRYQVQGFLERGATARVYIAEDLVTQTPVAVKILAADKAPQAEFRKRLYREAEAMRSIDHPNVVRVIDVGETEEGVPFMVMEALLGETLGEYLRRDGTIPLDTALILLKQAAAGLAAAHRVGVVHRDVKPDNFVLLGPPGEPYGLKVIDFGLAKLGSRAGASTTENILGTAEYMAPEQILVEEVDARSDIYSLGVVMFRMLTGHLPFESVSQADLLRHQLFSSVPPPSWLNEQLEEAVDQIVHSATRKHRENRYRSMDEVISALDSLLGLPGTALDSPRAAHAPDAYVPSTERGREALTLLAEKFGVHAGPRTPS